MNIYCLIASIEDATPTNYSRGELRLRDAIRQRHVRRRAIVPTLSISLFILVVIGIVLSVL